jgi:hypothetical protein
MRQVAKVCMSADLGAENSARCLRKLPCFGFPVVRTRAISLGGWGRVPGRENSPLCHLGLDESCLKPEVGELGNKK